MAGISHKGKEGQSFPGTMWVERINSARGSRTRAQGRSLEKLSLSLVKKLGWIPVALPCWSLPSHPFFSLQTVSLIVYF